MKSYDGCCTCRLRKKRCDEIRPVCRNCSALQITCHFGDEKPSWMDGGFGQREKADEIKREVRTAAARRRGVLPIEPIAAESDKDADLTTAGLNRPSASRKRSPLRGEPTLDSRP